MASPEFPVTPSVLRWARETSGFSVDEVAKKLESVSKKITPETVLRWEQGETLPRLTALRKLTEIYKRPMAVFFLENPPHEPPPPKSFRLLHTEKPRPLSPKMLLAVRTARRLYHLAKEISEELGYEMQAELPHAHQSDDPAMLAARERERLGVSFEEQSSFRDAGKALWYWRDLIENTGCFVFQLPFPVEDARAFSEYHEDGPIIVLPTSIDEPHVARIFSLFHEYGHLLLRTSGICPDLTVDYINSPEGRVEQFCNAFAANFLVPPALLELAAENLPEPTSERGLTSLSYTFSVSKHVILRRLLDAEWIDRSHYRAKVDEWEEQRKAKPKSATGGGPKQEVKSVSQRGRRLASLVVEAADRGVIAPPAVHEGLGIRPTFLGDVRAQLTL